jgi:hypothetical protein
LSALAEPGSKKHKPLGLAPPTDMVTGSSLVKRISALNIKEKYEKSQQCKIQPLRAIFTSEPCGDVAACCYKGAR